MTADGLVDINDVNAWLVAAGAQNVAVTGGSPFLVGDANLDGAVDVSDFNVWNSNKFQSSQGWCGGDFNADGAVDVSDFNIWNANKFMGSAGGRPEERPLVERVGGPVPDVGVESAPLGDDAATPLPVPADARWLGDAEGRRFTRPHVDVSLASRGTSQDWAEQVGDEFGPFPGGY